MLQVSLHKTSQSWTDYENILETCRASLPQGSTIIELGGGANPSLSQDQVKDFTYIVVDISKEELDKAKGIHFQKISADISKEKLSIRADFIFSKMLLEHIPNPQKFHEAIFELLKKNGIALHFYATLYSPASIINLFFPESISRKILYLVQKRNWEVEGKFPAYYRWSKGPTQKQQERFISVGYSIEWFNGYLGSGYLYSVPILNYVEKIYNFFILKMASPLLCSNAIVLLKRNL
jgi:SAM-dependent methyltransferase